MLTVEQRIRISILIEKMNKQKVYCEKLGLEDISKFHGKRISREEGDVIC